MIIIRISGINLFRKINRKILGYQSSTCLFSFFKNPVLANKVSKSKEDIIIKKNAPLFAKSEIKGHRNNNDCLNDSKRITHSTRENNESIVSEAYLLLIPVSKKIINIILLQ